MVDVPTPQEPTTQMPTSRVSAGDIKGTYDLQAQQLREGDISQGLQQLGQGLDAIATPIAAEAGRQAGENATITRNPDGTPKVQLPGSLPILGNAGLAYQRAAEAGALARGQNAVARDVADIRVDANGDPQKYIKGVSDYADKVRANMPSKLGDAMAADAERLGTQHYGAMLQQEHAQTVQNSQTAIEAQLAAAKNEALVLAAQPGGTNSDAFKTAKARINGYYDQLTGNPLFGYPAEKAELEKKHFQDYATATNTQAAVGQVFNKKGRAEAIKVIDDQITNNPNLNLSEQERTHLRSVALARLQELTDLQKADADAIRPATTAFEEGLRSGKVSPDDPVLQATIDRARTLGGPAVEDLQRLEMAAEVARRSVHFNGLSSRDMVHGSMVGVPATFDPNNTDHYLNATKSIENPGGDPNAVSPTGAKGDYQFTKVTAAQYGVVNPFDSGQSRDAARRLAIDNAASMTKTLGRPVTEGEVYLAHQQGAGGAAALLAHPGMNAVQALATYAYDGDVQKADQAIRVNGGNPSMTAGEFASKWTSRFDGNGVAARAVGVARAQLDANPWYASAYARQLSADTGTRDRIVGGMADGVVAGIKAGQAPPADAMALISQVAQSSDTVAEKLTKIRQAAAAEGLSSGLLQGSSAYAQSGADELIHRTSGADLYTQAVARAVKENVTGQLAQRKTDPWGAAERSGWIPSQPAPLNFNDQNALAGGLRQRAQAALTIGSRENNPDQSMFSPTELQQVQATMSGGTLAQKSMLLSAMVNSGATDRVYKSTMNQLSGSDDDKAMLAQAGVVAKDNPTAAQNILRGQELLKAEPRLAPREKDLQPAFSRSLPQNDFPVAADRARILNSAKAYYANLSAGIDDKSENFNQNRWDESIKAVTGGVVNFRGSHISAPWYGASEGETRAAIQAITPEDLRGAITADGAPFPANALKSREAFTSGNWRLQSLADGKYLVFSGDSENRRYLQRDRLDARDPSGAFVLDLSAKKGTVSDTSLGGILPPPVLAPPFGSYSPGTKGPLPVSTEMGQ